MIGKWYLIKQHLNLPSDGKLEFKTFYNLDIPPKNISGKKQCAMGIIAQRVKFHKQTPSFREISHPQVDNISPRQKD